MNNLLRRFIGVYCSTPEYEQMKTRQELQERNRLLQEQNELLKEILHENRQN